jgi:ankyrin repeat protein
MITLKTKITRSLIALLGVGILVVLGPLLYVLIRPLPAVDKLRNAAQAGNVAAVRRLLASGADPNAIDPYQEACNCTDFDPGKAPALAYAIYNSEDKPEHLDAASVLLDAGADPNTREEWGMTALMHVSSVAAAVLLIRHGASIDAVDDNGTTVLEYAAVHGYPTVVTFLCKHGAIVNAKNKDSETALMDAAEDGSAECVKALLSAGADVNARNRNGQSALKLAHDCPDVVALLKAAGAIA